MKVVLHRTACDSTKQEREQVTSQSTSLTRNAETYSVAMLNYPVLKQGSRTTTASDGELQTIVANRGLTTINPDAIRGRG